MPRTRKPAISAKNIQGLKYFKRLQPLFASLHGDIGVDPSGNRQLHYDQYASPESCSLHISSTPTLTSLRRLQPGRFPPGKGSGQTRLPPRLLRRRLQRMTTRALRCRSSTAHHRRTRSKKPCRCTPARRPKSCCGLTAVGRQLAPCLTEDGLGTVARRTGSIAPAKLHSHFDVFKGVPCYATVTDSSNVTTKKQQLHVPPCSQARRLYVIDRGYAEYQLLPGHPRRRLPFHRPNSRQRRVRSWVEERPLSDEALPGRRGA